jgi:hypothetical protein
MSVEYAGLQLSPAAFGSASAIVALPPGRLTHISTTIRQAGVEAGVVLNLWTQNSEGIVSASNPANHSLLRDVELVHNVGEDATRELSSCKRIPAEHRFVAAQADNVCCLADVLFVGVAFDT